MHDSSYAIEERSTTFFNKVLGLFAFAILISASGVFLAPSILPATSMAFYACIGVELILVFTARIWSQKRPINKILFGLFAFISGMTAYPIIAFATLQGGIGIVGQALVATFLMFGGAALYGHVTQRDLSGIGGFLMMALIGLILVGILQIFWYNSTVHLISSGIGVILFAAFAAYDIQRIKRYPENMALEAALHLYLDIFNLFLQILHLMLALTGRNR